MDQAKPESDAEEYGSKSPYQDPKGPLRKMRQQLGNRGTESELSASEHLGLLPDCPLFSSRARLGEKGGWKEERPSSMMECSVYLDDQQSMADCTMTRSVIHSATPVIFPPLQCAVPLVQPGTLSDPHPRVQSALIKILSLLQLTYTSWANPCL
ncbi:uncharacterized protein hmgxb4b isoform X2 [Echeneis naucrates]|uniref:uncharacterized protein hmgxb4b isoform X2 n=1 Tax=Echeneis naucrates TaxID=173247 RepID=UPI001114199C|nr:uncharacterized protein LOC115041721 isoform X2 [Echeneis naucrates]